MTEDAMNALVKLGAGPGGLLYAHALELFVARVAVVEAATGLTLLCEEKPGVEPGVVGGDPNGIRVHQNATSTTTTRD